jgi:ABC-type microcin C transport system duplicated ATPase subunit YejF
MRSGKVVEGDVGSLFKSPSEAYTREFARRVAE